LIRSFSGTSIIEYPGHISAVIFIGGCNFYCPFCHNPELVKSNIFSETDFLTHDEVLAMLIKRSGFIEAVSITGGEPLSYDGLEELISRIKDETDFLIKVDTNGTFPEKLKVISPSVDYIAMDLKSSPDGYFKATGGKAVFDDVRKSIEFIKTFDEHEFRTTMVPGIVTSDDVITLLKEIGPIDKYVLQLFRSEKTLSDAFSGIPTYPADYIEVTVERIKELSLAIEVITRI